MPRNNDRLTPKRRFRVGDRIQFLWGGHKLSGVVLEDRGNLGQGGMQIVRLRTQFDPYAEPVEFEMREDALELVEPAP